jgi:enamine deaminase RidA (YjgF/YER057c/UK114 family)
MLIEHHEILDPGGAKPIISGVTAFGNMVYVKGVTANPAGDITDQTRQVLKEIDRLLAVAGTDKSKLLTAQVWLSDMKTFRQHNLAWNEWVDPVNPPVRACVEARLFAPGLLVEIMVTAIR